MREIFGSLLIFVLFFSVKLIAGANRWGWNGGGGGGNRVNGNGNRWKQGGGGFNSWRQQTFKHNNNNRHNVFNSNNNEDTANNFNNQYDNSFNGNNNNFHSFNSFKQPEHEHTNSKPDSNVPSVSFSHIPSQTNCAVPTMGDSSKFELRCIFTNSDQDEDCSVGGSYLPTGTTVMLRCKPPYVSDSGDLRIWACEEGVWKGEFKSFGCTHPPINSNSNHHNAGDNSFGNTNSNKQPNNNHFNQPNSHWSKNQNQKEQGNWQQNTNKDDKPLIPGLIPGLINEAVDVVQESPQVVPAVVVEEPAPVLPPWFSALEKWKPPPTSTTTTSTTTTTPTTTTTRPTTTATITTTTTTTTSRPYLPPVKTDSPGTGWNFNERKEENETKCPSLSKGTGIQLECLSKSKVPWDPSSFLVSQSDCGAPQKIGTEATYKCEQYYEANLGLTIQYRKCKEDGTWTGGENRFSCALECGKSNPVGRIPLITNGEPTYKAQWPWHAALFYQDARKGQSQYDYNCGATLINRRVVLTAAHCVTERFSKSIRSVAQFRVDLGRYERTVEDEFVQTFLAEDIIIHPSYNPISFDSDIAIIILKGAVAVGFHVRPICYPQTQNSAFEELHLSDGSYGTVVGFGNNENGELSDVLHMAKLKVVSQQECSESFADTNFGATLTKSTTFCAGLKNGTNVCSGDSGGGIYFPLNSGGSSRWYLQGLVSVGITAQDGSNRCDPTRYSVYTRISPYADWIVRILSERDAL